jgi:hypothetical protein
LWNFSVIKFWHALSNYWRRLKFPVGIPKISKLLNFLRLEYVRVQMLSRIERNFCVDDSLTIILQTPHFYQVIVNVGELSSRGIERRASNCFGIEVWDQTWKYCKKGFKNVSQKTYSVMKIQLFYYSLLFYWHIDSEYSITNEFAGFAIVDLYNSTNKICCLSSCRIFCSFREPYFLTDFYLAFRVTG